MIYNLVVVVTVHNGERYLKECLDSCLAALTPSSHIVVIDDGSSDRSYQIASSYPESSVSALALGRVGRGVALNHAIKHVKARHYAILDADDKCLPERFQVQLDIMKARSDIDCLCSRFTVKENYSKTTDTGSDSLIELISTDFFISNPICHSTVMFRATIFDHVGLYDTNRINLYDLDFWVRILKAKKKIAAVDKLLVFKRIHDEQYFESRLRIKYLLDTASLKLKLLDMTNIKMISLIKIYLSFIYGLLPQGCRLFFRTFLHNG